MELSRCRDGADAFDEDAVFTSPVAQRVGFARDGVVRGKDALRRYWLCGPGKKPGLAISSDRPCIAASR